MIIPLLKKMKIMRLLLILLQMHIATAMTAATGTWHSTATGSNLNYTTSSATGVAAQDVNGKAMTIVYLENLGFQKIGQNSNADDVAWLRNEGYQVIELDLVYPANPSVEVPVVVTFSYSSSFATNSNGKLTDTNKHKRMYLPYFWGAFKDSFVEGASAVGFAWAVCDHPKYCDWGQGRYTGGANKSLGAIEVNPDAARKVKSAIRTVRSMGRSLGLNGQVAVTGFSRGSTAAAVAVGDGRLDAYEDATRGCYPEESSLVQCSLLGSGMFDYEHALSTSNEYMHMNSFVTANPYCPWAMQGALATIETNASAPTLFFYNTDDYYKDSNKDPQGLYATQAELMKARLDAVGTPTATLVDYSSGHAVPQTTTTLQVMYDFLTKYIPSPIHTGIAPCIVSPVHPSADATFNLMGMKVTPNYKGIVINNGRKLMVK